MECADQSAAPTLTWVVGESGLLGRHISAALGPQTPRYRTGDIPWGSPEVPALLAGAARQLMVQAGNRPWQVLWCANSSILGASPNALQAEIDALVATLGSLMPSPGHENDGAFFFPSSVGGVYGGIPAPPFDEFSPVGPITPYGIAKLESERVVSAWSAKTGVPSLIGRITNLYGPGQNLRKPQGLISQMCVAHLKHRPITLWVPLDTRRDYIFTRDAALLILAGMARLRSASKQSSNAVVTKVIGTGSPSSIAAVLGELRRVFRRTPLVVMADTPVSSVQAPDLSIRSRVWPDLDQRTFTSLPAGIASTLSDLRQRQQRGLL